MKPVEIATMLWQDGCEHELRIIDKGRPVVLWIPCESYRAFARMLDHEGCQISVVPRLERKSWMTGRAPVVWTALTGGSATAALERFRPAPTLVLRAGRTQTRWALWALWAPLWGTYIERATERLSYALHGVRRAAKPETLIPAPWAKVDGRQIWIEHELPEIYTAKQVVGHLRDAPPADGWRTRKAAA